MLNHLNLLNYQVEEKAKNVFNSQVEEEAVPAPRRRGHLLGLEADRAEPRVRPHPRQVHGRHLRPRGAPGKLELTTQQPIVAVNCHALLTA